MHRLLALLLLSPLLAPIAAAQEPDSYFQDQYEFAVDRSLNFASCGWEVAKGALAGEGQSTAAVRLAETRYNTSGRDAAKPILLSAPLPAIVVFDHVWGPGVARSTLLVDETATYTKCAAAHYSTWAARTFLWSLPTVDCFWVHSDCGLANLDCNARMIDATFDAVDWLFGPISGPPAAPTPCVPPAGAPCMNCPPQPYTKPFPAVPTLQELTGE